MARWERVRSTVGLLSESDSDSSEQMRISALLIPNQELLPSLPKLWRRAGKCVCADGGANRLHDNIARLLEEESHPERARASHLPNLIVGDMDSIRPDVLGYYSNRGVEVVDKGHDQETTDLHKCIANVTSQLQAKESGGSREEDEWIVAAGGLGGRLDHELAALSTLHTFMEWPIILMGPQSLAFVVAPGRWTIKPDFTLESRTCGLIPLQGSATVSTRGLRWDLASDTMRFGGLVSTSNHLESDAVEVDTDAPLLWTSALRDSTSCPPFS